jgi:hypothetical protein
VASAVEKRVMWSSLSHAVDLMTAPFNLAPHFFKPNRTPLLLFFVIPPLLRDQLQSSLINALSTLTTPHFLNHFLASNGALLLLHGSIAVIGHNIIYTPDI